MKTYALLLLVAFSAPALAEVDDTLEERILTRHFPVRKRDIERGGADALRAEILRKAPRELFVYATEDLQQGTAQPLWLDMRPRNPTTPQPYIAKNEPLLIYGGSSDRYSVLAADGTISAFSVPARYLALSPSGPVALPAVRSGNDPLASEVSAALKNDPKAARLEAAYVACRNSPAVKARARHNWNHPKAAVVWVKRGDNVSQKGEELNVADEMCNEKFNKLREVLEEPVRKKLGAERDARRAAVVEEVRRKLTAP